MGYDRTATGHDALIVDHRSLGLSEGTPVDEDSVSASSRLEFKQCVAIQAGRYPRPLARWKKMSVSLCVTSATQLVTGALGCSDKAGLRGFRPRGDGRRELAPGAPGSAPGSPGDRARSAWFRRDRHRRAAHLRPRRLDRSTRWPFSTRSASAPSTSSATRWAARSPCPSPRPGRGRSAGSC